MSNKKNLEEFLNSQGIELPKKELTPEQKKSEEFALKIVNHFMGVFSEEDEEGKININELAKDEKNVASFLHALGNILPTIINNKFSDDEGKMNVVEMNHYLNGLLFIFTKVD